MPIIKSPYTDPPPARDINVHHVLLQRPDQAQWPDFTLHIDALTGESRTYRDFLARVNDLATALHGPTSQGCLGIGAKLGDTIGIMMQNSSDYISLIHASLVNTIPFALIPSQSTAFELKYALQLSMVTSIFVDPQLLPILIPVAQEIGFDMNNIFIGHGSAPGRRSIEDLINHIRSKSIPFIGIKAAEKDTLAYLIFSSGTSGLPKAVMISHGNVMFSLSQGVILRRAALEVHTPPPPATPERIPVGLAFLPLHHSYCLHIYNFRALLAPMTVVFMKQWDIDLALTAISKYSVTNVGLVPSVVLQLLHHPKTAQTDWSTVTTLGCGAAYLSPELASKLSKLLPVGIDLWQGYGMSEATIGAISQPYPGSLGGKAKRIPGWGVDETGQLWIQGGNVALGYFNNEKANKESFVDGWLNTGDRFKMDSNHNFWFADRAKDTLKVSGTQVSPAEIEDCLLANPDNLIIDVSVAGVNGHGRTSDEKVPRAWIVLSAAGKNEGEKATIKVLDKWVQKSLSKYKWIRGGYEVVEALPKSPTGKVLRRILVDKYERTVSEETRSKL